MRFQLAGLVAWLPWLFVRILYLAGVKNRITIFLFWSSSYAFLETGRPD